jgi:protein O-GlcNAc transferase
MNKFISTISKLLVLGAITSGCSNYTSINSATMASNNNSLKEANELYKKGNYNKAVAIYEKLINEKSSKESMLSYAESLRLTNNCHKAIDIYDKLLNFDSTNVDAMEGKGLCTLVMGEFQKSAELLSQVVEADTNKWKSVNALGVIYALKGFMDESMEYYNIAVKESRYNPTVLNNIGLSLAFSGDYKRGKTILEKSLEFSGDSDAKKKKQIELNLALIHGLAGNLEKSKEILDKHLTEAEVMNNLGFYASLSDDKDLAKSYLAKALAISPDHYEKAWNNLQSLDLEVNG